MTPADMGGTAGASGVGAGGTAGTPSAGTLAGDSGGAAGSANGGAGGDKPQSTSCTPARPHASGRTPLDIQHDGSNRDYVLFVPTAYEGTKPLPVVVNIHGGSSFATEELDRSKWDKMGEQANFACTTHTSCKDGTQVMECHPPDNHGFYYSSSNQFLLVGPGAGRGTARHAAVTTRLLALGRRRGAAY